MDATAASKASALLTAGVEQARRVLETDRHPVMLGEVPHTFDDKYAVAEGATRCAAGAALCCVDLLLGGALSGDALQHLVQQTVQKGRTATLDLRSKMECTYTRMEKEKVKKEVVKTYFWQVTCTYEVRITSAGKAVASRKGTTSVEASTLTKRAPMECSGMVEQGACDLTWLLSRVASPPDEAGDAHPICFAIDRDADSCHTARRNTEVAEAERFFAGAAEFARGVKSWHAGLSRLEAADAPASIDISGGLVLMPALPVVAVPSNADQRSLQAAGESGALLVPEEIQALAAEQRRQLCERAASLQEQTAPGSLAQGREAAIAAVSQHLKEVCRGYADSVGYLEALLADQLVQAVGKSLSSDDFAAYMGFHMRRVMVPRFAPRGLALSVRHGTLNPEGCVILEDTRFADAPVPTLTRCFDKDARFRFALNATAEAVVAGPASVHAFVDHHFGSAAGSVSQHLRLRATAQQFSSFVVLLGTLGSADLFLPQFAVVVQNKDVFEIPLLLETIPSHKEFRNAVESLSPQQRAFAEAYRSMQLQGTLFGMCVVQVKPQLEAVLGLPSGSLTKEIRLTQDLLMLFMGYSIRSDLLAFDGHLEGVTSSPKECVACVQQHVDKLKGMLLQAKEDELADSKMVNHKRGYYMAESDRRTESPPKKKAKAPTCIKKEKFKVPKLNKYYSLCLDSRKASPNRCSLVESSVGFDTPMAEGPEPVTSSSPGEGGPGLDITTFPEVLEAQLAASGVDSLRPTTLKPGRVWQKRSQRGLLGVAETAQLLGEAHTSERLRAMGLLDSLTRSGLLPLQGEMHVLVGSTHSFSATLMDTLVKGNVNPIPAVEASTLLVAATLQEVAPKDLVLQGHAARVEAACATSGEA